ncbi:hypothetical protein IAT38_006112 [Cryptococcus sp. DSM 104549]
MALEYAVQGFAIKVQTARVVADGAIISSWIVFVLLLNLALVSPVLYLLQVKRLLAYMFKWGKAMTPRQRFKLRLPPSYTPSYGVAASLVAVFYACPLLFIYPLLAIPIIVLLYLSLVAHRYMSEHVFVERSGGYIGILTAIWTVRRFGWILPVQPVLYGLLLLSRDEWVPGGVSLGVAAAILMLSEVLTVGRFPRSRQELARALTGRSITLGVP